MILHRARILAWIAWDASSFFEWLAARPWYMEILTDWLQAIPVTKGDTGLEVGCGPGLLAAAAAARGVTMTGLDRSSAMVERARSNAPECTFIVGDALELPLTDKRDVAFAASVVNVVDNPEKLVREMTRIVRPGGRVSVLFPTPRLAEHATTVAKGRGIVGLSGAALATWGSKAPKRDPEQIREIFETVELQDNRTDWFFDETVASVTGRAP